MGTGIEEAADPRRFKIRKKVLASGLGEIWDPGQIPIKLKSKQPDNSNLKAEVKLEGDAPEGPANSSADASDRPKWHSKGWKRAGVEIDPEKEQQIPSSGDVNEECRSPITKLEGVNNTTAADIGQQLGGGTVNVKPDPDDLGAKSSVSVKEEEGIGSTQQSISATEGGNTPVFKKRRKPQNGAGNRETLR